MTSAGYDDGATRGHCGQPGQVDGVTGEDPVAGAGQEHHRGVDRVGGICLAKQDACVTASLVIDVANINSLEQSCQLDLPPVRVAPYLSYHHRVTAQFKSMLLGGAQAKVLLGSGDSAAVRTPCSDS